MGTLSDETILKKLKQTITTKLSETRQHVERELPEYIVSMITNKKSKSYMVQSLEAFIGDDTDDFCEWLTDLVNKINETSEPNLEKKKESTSNTSVKEEKRKETREKPSTISRSEISTRKRKGASPPLRGHRPIEAPKKELERRSPPRRESPRRYDREMKRGTRRHQSRSPRRHSREKEKITKRQETPPRRALRRTRSSSKASSKTYSDFESDHEFIERNNNVASMVVAQRRIVSAPKVSSQVNVKRNIRHIGDEKLMKARSKMFVNALTAASNSTQEEPVRKTRIVEKTISIDAKPNKEDKRIFRVRLDVSKPPTKRMEEEMRKIILEAKSIESVKKVHSKRKHEEIVYDLDEENDDNRVYLDITNDEEEDDEGKIDKIVKESKMETDKAFKWSNNEEPPAKRTRSKQAEKEHDAKSKTRCSYWPKCTRGDACHFLHPNAICAVFPKCSYGNSCHYVHPPCKFANNCKNNKCAYTHGDPNVLKMLGNYFPFGSYVPQQVQIPEKRKQAPIIVVCGVTCRFKNKCKNAMCQFDHPQICKYKDTCIADDCPYFHPPPALPKQHQMKKLDNSKYRWNSQHKAQGEIAEIII